METLLTLFSELLGAGRAGRLDERIGEWTEAGLITEEQAGDIRAHEAAKDPGDAAPRRRAWIAEVLGYWGGLLVAGGVLVLFEDYDRILGPGLAALICAALALGLGWTSARAPGWLEGGVGGRLGTFLGLISVAAAAGAGVFLADVVVGHPSDSDAAGMAGVVGALGAWLLYRLRPGAARQLALFACVALAPLSLVDGFGPAAAVWAEAALGVAWFVLGRRDLLRPAGVALELGAIMALVCLALSTLTLESLGALRPEVGTWLAMGAGLVLLHRCQGWGLPRLRTRVFQLLCVGGWVLLMSESGGLRITRPLPGGWTNLAEVMVCWGLGAAMLIGAAKGIFEPAAGLYGLGGSLMLTVPVLYHWDLGLWASLITAALLLAGSVRLGRVALMVPAALAMLVEIPVIIFARFKNVVSAPVLVIVGGVAVIALALGLLRLRSFVGGGSREG